MAKMKIRVIDAYIYKKNNAGIDFLILKRAHTKIYEHLWQGVAGKIESGEEAWEAAIRELKEETSVSGHNPTLFAVHGDPRRDPRQHIVTIFYSIDVDENVVPLGGDDAAEAMWMPLEKLEQDHVAGDHYDIIKKLRKEK